MIELYEFRVREEYAKLIFNQNEGKKLGWSKRFGNKFVSIRKVELSGDDPRLKKVGELNALVQKDHNDFFFTGWSIRRQYTPEEISLAELFLISRFATFEPAGEECGTKYDESSACKKCGAGAQQSSPLFLNWKRIPKGKDFARTIAGEIICSRRAMEIFKDNSATGVEFRKIRHHPASSAESKDWFQLWVQSKDAEITPSTRVGINPFDDDPPGKYRCPSGDILGLARLSEVFVDRQSYNGLDFVASRQFVGMRAGLLRPERFLLISPKIRRLVEEEKLKGCKFEIAHLQA